jgi:hypothetical protein
MSRSAPAHCKSLLAAPKPHGTAALRACCDHWEGSINMGCVKLEGQTRMLFAQLNLAYLHGVCMEQRPRLTWGVAAPVGSPDSCRDPVDQMAL